MLLAEVFPNIVVPPPKPPKLVPVVAVGTVLNKPPVVWVVFPNKEVPVDEVGAPNVDAKPPKPVEEVGTPNAELVGAPKEPVPPNAVPVLVAPKALGAAAPKALGAAAPNADVVEVAPKGVVFAVDAPKAGVAVAPKAGAACPKAV